MAVDAIEANVPNACEVIDVLLVYRSFRYKSRTLRDEAVSGIDSAGVLVQRSRRSGQELHSSEID